MMSLLILPTVRHLQICATSCFSAFSCWNGRVRGCGATERDGEGTGDAAERQNRVHGLHGEWFRAFALRRKSKGENTDG